jgi:hypothetical protein
MKVGVGDHVSAMPLPCDGQRRVRGVVLELRGGLVLLDVPHGRWCVLATALRLSRPLSASPRAEGAAPRRRA